MRKAELKKYVDEYFKRYMCAETLDKFIENWEETENWCEYFRKENEQLKSIIKEARERMLNENKPLPSPREIIEILDKVGETDDSTRNV